MATASPDKYILTQYNCETGETIVRKLTEQEIAELPIIQEIPEA
jgi:hypothetical protein